MSSEYEKIGEVRYEIYKKKPKKSGGDRGELALILSALLIIYLIYNILKYIWLGIKWFFIKVITIIGYILFPWLYPIYQFFLLNNTIEKEAGTTIAIFLFVLSIGVISLIVTLILDEIFNFSKFIFFLVIFLFTSWIAYFLLNLINSIFGIA